MPISAIGKADQGLSLIEMLLVLGVMGLFGAVIITTLPEGEDSLRREAERLAVSLDRAVTQARLQGRPLGVDIDGRGAVFMTNRQGRWQPAPLDPLVWHPQTRVRLQRDGEDRIDDPTGTEVLVDVPDLVLDPLGVMTDAQVELQRGQDRYRVTLDLVGEVHVARVR